MSDRSSIEWTDATWNPIRVRLKETGPGSPKRLAEGQSVGQEKLGWHCEHVSPGCEHCYAEAVNHRFGTGLAFKPGHRNDLEFFLDEETLLQPLRWKKPRQVFVCSMSDLFASFVPDAFIDKIVAVMAAAPRHQFQVLTKRPERMREYLTSPATVQRIIERLAEHAELCGADTIRAAEANWNSWAAGENLKLGNDKSSWPLWPLKNVWLGVSVEDQQRADERIPLLLDTPASVRFISAEPLLGPVDLHRWLWISWRCSNCHEFFAGTHRQICPSCGSDGGWTGSHPFNGRHRPVDRAFPPQSGSGLDWVIVGGESGRDARPMHPDWARKLRDQCAGAEVAFFFKQWGEWESSLDRDRDDPDWRRDYSNDYVDHGKSRWLNLEGGRGFHGERFHVMRRVGKSVAGRLLDGVTHDAMPAVGLAPRPVGPEPIATVRRERAEG